jgi:ABC-type lipoprotein release transport system permease subunit
MITASLRHSWRVSVAVAFGVATATAVIAGALLVGDSMRGSLRALTIERLGKTESVVIPGGFFQSDGIVGDDVDVVPLVLFSRGVAETQADASPDNSIKRAGSVQIIGCDENFWTLDASGVTPKQLPQGERVVLNQTTADELGVVVGDKVTIRLPVEQAVPADSPLGRRDIQSRSLPRMEVVEILPDRGLGRFSIAANQAAPQNVFISREIINDALDRQGQANALLFDQQISPDQLNVRLADLGLQLDRITRTYREDDQTTTVFDYYSLTSNRLLLSEIAVNKVMDELGGDKVTPVTTYLANAIERMDTDGQVVASVPYSTISAIDSTQQFPLDYQRRNSDATTSDRVPLVINSWTADQLSAEVGTPLRVAYFEPEVENGREVERYFDAVVTGIVPITEPAEGYTRRRAPVFDQLPTIYNDPDLTPTVAGLTDQASINDWDIPFKLTRKTSAADDDYWDNHRATPKAFLPLEDGQRLFGSRFGKTTGLRIPTDIGSEADLAARILTSLQPVLPELGWSVRPIRSQQLDSSRGTTPFDALFLSLSFFVILAAVMLIAMLFRLGLIQRLRQFGTLIAVGWTPRQVTRLTLIEGLVIAAGGAVLGVIGGIYYAKIVLWALRTYWVGAVTVPFLTFHWNSPSLIIGALAGWLVAGLTIWLTIRSLLKADAQTLISGRDTDKQVARTSRGRRLPIVAAIVALLAVLIAAAGAAAGGQAAAGGFVGGGMLLLIAMLMAMYARLSRPKRIENQSESVRGYSVSVLAARNASRHPLRSTLTIGLMATASFLIIAITAFRLQPTERGTGGFDLIAQSATPLYRDLSDNTVQSDLLGADAKLLKGATVAALRMRIGQDASCNNLYQAAQPTVLGIPDRFGELFTSGESPLAGFEWAGHGEVAAGISPWQLLEQTAAGTEEDPVPVVLDQNTAMWSLQMRGGVGETRSFEYQPGQPIYFQVVGLLSNSMLQGRLLIGDKNFRELFPDISGSQYFLVACPAAAMKPVATALETWLGDIGMDVTESATVLSGMLAVQNTYLRTFQSLGALGLLLGTIGLAVAQLRSVLERKHELAVMGALGFTRRRLGRVVMSETAALLLAGIGCGAVCAVLAIAPYAILSGLKPPVTEPIIVIVGIIVFGLLAGMLAVRQVLRLPLTDSLRPQ